MALFPWQPGFALWINVTLFMTLILWKPGLTGTRYVRWISYSVILTLPELSSWLYHFALFCICYKLIPFFILAHLLRGWLWIAQHGYVLPSLSRMSALTREYLSMAIVTDFKNLHISLGLYLLNYKRSLLEVGVSVWFFVIYKYIIIALTALAKMDPGLRDA